MSEFASRRPLPLLLSLALPLVLTLSAAAQPFPPDVVWSDSVGTSVQAVAFSPDGQTVASAAARGDDTDGGRVDLLAALDGTVVASATTHPDATNGFGPAGGLAFSPDGQALASAHGVVRCDPTCAPLGEGVFTWAVPSLTPQAGSALPAEAALDVARAAADGPIGVVYGDGTIRLLDPVTLAEQLQLPGHTDSTYALAFSPSGTRLASVGADGMLKVWDAVTGALEYEVQHGTEGSGGLPVSVAFSANGAFVATGGKGSAPTVRVWESADGTSVYTFNALVLPSVGGDGVANDLAFAPNGRYLLGGLAQEIELFPSGETERLAGLWFWDLTTGERAALYEDESAPEAEGVTAVAISPVDDKRFAYALGGRVKVAETPLSLVQPVGDPGFFVLAGTTLPQGDTYESVAPADYDSDGDLDLLVIRGEGRFPDTLQPELYRNDGDDGDGGIVFTRAPFPADRYPDAASGGDPYGETLSWADYDNDGDIDALVATPYGTAIYRNDGGTFVESGQELPVYEEFLTFGFAEPASSAWGDYDNDGDLDLVLPMEIEAPGITPDTTRLVLYNNDGGTLTPTEASFPDAFYDPHLVWGDLENDGDLDLLYLSPAFNCSETELGECLLLYENTEGTLAPLEADFPDFSAGAADFGDFDLDGDLDILLVAAVDQPDGPPFVVDRAIVYRNDGGDFVADTLQFPFSFDEFFQDLTGGEWADYDSDGDMDVVIGAYVNDFGGPNPDFGGAAFVFANTDGVFALAATVPASQRFGTRTWADFDGDGDLDFLATGQRVEDGTWEAFARFYRNDVPASNRAPAPPSGLVATPTADGATLAWGAADDDNTPADALTYNLHVRARLGSDIVSPMSRSGDGTRLIPMPGNVSLNRSWTLRSLPEGEYEWRVQAVDNAFNGGAFAEGGSFVVGAVDADGDAVAPAAFAVQGAFPNPLRRTGALRLDLPEAGEVTVMLYDVLGREVLRAPPHDMVAGAGLTLGLDASELPSGVYVWRVQAVLPSGTERASGRFTVVR